jgi:alkaline phosphatase
MKKLLSTTILFLFCISFAHAGSFKNYQGKKSFHQAKKAEIIARFGVITDIHHTNKPDTTSRKYSAALEKTSFFVKTMNRKKVDFIIELGDFLDMLVDDKDPVQNLFEIEDIYTSFKGPQYHVLGNHEFDNVKREDLLNYLDNTGIPAGETYYSFDHNGIHCIVLDADYTNEEPHLPFDLQDPANPFWNWKDAWVPQEELDWLKADLATSDLPTVVFTHQVVHRGKLDGVTENHTIKNADAVRSILEADGQVLAVFSGHDHRGEVAVRNGIHYFVLEGNVGISQDWSNVSATDGLDAKKDCPFVLVEILETKQDEFNGMKTYQIRLKGNAQQYSYVDEAQIFMP